MDVPPTCRAPRSGAGNVRACGYCRSRARRDVAVRGSGFEGEPMISGMRTDASRASTDAIAARAAERYQNLRAGIFVLTDRTFAALMLAQWMVAIIVAMVISPSAWQGKSTTDYMHVWAAFVVGGILTAPPVALAFLRPASPLTRHWVAVSQMLWSALLIHLTGGWIETHFHAFVLLAGLAFYRDWKGLLPATGGVVGGHVGRGGLLAQAPFGGGKPPGG